MSLVRARLTFRSLRLPAPVPVGDADIATPVSTARELQSAIHGAQPRIIPNVAHIPTVEEPHAVSKAMLGFLDSLPIEISVRYAASAERNLQVNAVISHAVEASHAAVPCLNRQPLDFE